MDEKIDYGQYRALAFDDTEEVYDPSRPLAWNLQRLFTEGLAMPHQNTQLPVLVSYMLIPTAMADIVPVAFLQGGEGSGKSTATILASHLHNSAIQTAATTFAALRNHINAMRWADPDYMEGERNYILLWDNVNRETLESEQIYTLLLCGYNRKTDEINISAGSGANQTFKVFGTKILSSIHPLFTQSKYAELIRRLVVFRFKKWERFTEDELADSPPDFDLSNRLDFDAIDLAPLKAHFDAFWKVEQHLCEYVTWKKRLKARKKSFKVPECIDSHKWTISIDILVTGLVTGVFSDLDDGLTSLGRYWQWHKDNVLSSWGVTHKLLQRAIDELTKTAVEINLAAQKEVVPLEITPKEIKGRLDTAYREGALDVIPNPTTVSDLMRDLGWKLDRSSNGKENVWTPIR